MAFIEKRDNKRWRARYRAPDGRERSKTFKRRVDAERFLTQVKAQMLRGEWIDPEAGKRTLGDFEKGWRPKATLARSSLALHDSAWRKWVGPALADYPLGAITRAIVQEFVEDVYRISGSSWTTQTAHRVLRKLLQEAVDQDLIMRNPALRVKLPKTERKRFEVLTPGQIARLVDAVGAEWHAFVLVKTYAALRFSEVAGLRVGCVDQERGHLRIEQVIVEAAGHLDIRSPKTEAGTRSVAVPDFVMTALKAHMKAYPAGTQGLVFHDRNGNPVRRSTFYRMWREATVQAGLPGFKVRNLRHTGASLAIDAGTDPIHLAKRLGHTSSAFTAKVYGQIYESKDREVAARLEPPAACTRPDDAQGDDGDSESTR